MKYDIISQINNTPTVEKLPDSVVNAIRIIQNQKFPELDGLHLTKVRRCEKGNSDSKIITPTITSLELNARNCSAFCQLEALTQQLGMNEEISDIELYSYCPKFYLSFTCTDKGNPIKYSLNYVYDRDIICFSYTDSDISPNHMISKLEIFINAANNKDITYNFDGRPKDLVPDIEKTESVFENDRSIFVNHNLIEKINPEILRIWRINANEIADLYHKYNEDYMNPRKR